MKRQKRRLLGIHCQLSIVYCQLIIIMFCGCGAKRVNEIRQKEDIQLEKICRDSVRLDITEESMKATKMDIAHIRLSEPDQQGRQYVETITHIQTVDSIVENKDSHFHSAETQEEVLTSDKELFTYSKKQTEKSRFLPWLFACLVILVLARVLWRYNRT